MRLLNSSFALVAALTILGQESAKAADSQAEQKALEAVTSFIEAFNDLDWNRFQAKFLPEATLFFPSGGPRTVWKEGASVRFNSMFDRFKERNRGKSPPYLNIAPEDMKVQVAGDVAITTFHLSSAAGRRTIVWHRRQNDWLILHLHASAIPAFNADASAAEAELKMIQGRWEVVALEANGKKAPDRSFKGKHFLIEGEQISFSGKPSELRRFRLGTGRAIDIPGRVEGQFSKAIYEVEEDTLRLCFSQSTQFDRPKDFNTAGTPYMCYWLQLSPAADSD